MELLKDIPILFVLCLFLTSLFYCFIKYVQVSKNLTSFIKYIQNFKKSDLNFRFKELDVWMSSNDFVSDIWQEFRNTLVFSESVALKDNDGLQYQEVSQTVQNVQTTVDPIYFFNEETLIISKFNYKIIQVMPTILTGCGPLFTFLKIAIAFKMIDFSTQERTLETLSGFMGGMQAAALVSVIAVGASLIFLLLEKMFYHFMCKMPLKKIQTLVGELFASISSEKFLYELLRESKIQNNSSANLISSIPVEFKNAFNESVITNLVPYLENIIYGLNQLNKEIKTLSVQKSDSDEVDNLF